MEPARDPSAKTTADHYEWLHILGEGAFGDVWLATDKETKTNYAIKKMLKSHLSKEANKKSVMNERNVLSQCNHPNIVKLYKAFRDDEYFYYVLSLAPNGELLGQVKKHKGLSLQCVQFYAAELVLCLEYLHTSIGCIHRDLKPENLLLDENMHLLLTDFGTSKLISKEEGKILRKGSFVGTPDYMPPELCKSTMSCFASDLWSLGVVVYQCLTARLPFRGATEYLTMQKVQGGIKNLVYPYEFPPVAKAFIESLLQLDPEARLGVNDFALIKAHPFFESINFNTVNQSTPPTPAPFGKMTWQEDVIREEQERAKEKQAEIRAKWEKFLRSSENIVEIGMVIKTRKMSHKKRCLILTDAPRLFYVDQKKMEYKGECLILNSMKIEIKNNIVWQIVLPSRVYYFEDLEKNSQRWADVLEPLAKVAPSK